MDEPVEPVTRDAACQLVEVSPDREFEALALTYKALGIHFPSEYVSRGSIFALLDYRQEIHGSAIVVDQPPFRSLQGISHASDTGRFGHSTMEQTAEINGVWLAENKRSLLASFTFWTQLLEQLLESEFRQFLFTFDNTNGRMTALVRWVGPKVVYSGWTKRLPGMKSVSNETIALMSRDMMETLLKLLRRQSPGRREAGESSLVARLGERSLRRAA